MITAITQQIYLTLTSLTTGQEILKLPVPDLTACHQLAMTYLAILNYGVIYTCGVF